MRYLTLITLLTIANIDCTAPKYYNNKYDAVSKSLRNDWEKCGINSFYAVGVDILNSTQIHLALCLDENRFNASLQPVLGKEGISKFYSGNYATQNDTIALTFDKAHMPDFLSDRIVYSADKKNLVWICRSGKVIKLTITKPGMNIESKSN